MSATAAGRGGPTHRGRDGAVAMVGYTQFIDLARVRVLVVPIADGASSSTFPEHGQQPAPAAAGQGSRTEQYVKELTAFSSVPLGELPPPPKEDSSIFNDISTNMGSDGFVYLNYVAAHDRETERFASLHLSNQVMAVVGVLICSEVSSLPAAYNAFSEVVSRYPSALAQRCFAFEPSSTTPDNIPGLIMIPNVGNLNVYLSQMIADLCAEVLGRFREVKASIESRLVVPSPVPYPLPPSSSQNPLEFPLRQAPAFNKASSAPSVGSSATNLSPSTAVAGPGGTVPASPATPTATNAKEDAQAAALDRWLSYTAMDPRTKKASPSRAQKLMGDLLLLAGRVEEAVTIYTDAIDGTKGNSDFLWQAAGMEGLVCANLIRGLRAAGMAGLNGSPTISPRTYSLPVTRPTGADARKAVDLRPEDAGYTLNEVLEGLPKRYRELMSLYEKGQSSLSPDALDKPVVMKLLPDGTPVAPLRSPSPSVATPEKPSLLDRVSSRFSSSSSSPNISKDIESTFSPLHSILVVRAAIRIARLLAGLHVQGAMVTFDGGADWHPANAASFLPSYADIRADASISPTRADVAAWLNKASSVLMQNAVLISVEDRCWASSAIAAIYAQLGMERKSAFHLRVACLTVIDELRKGPRGGVVGTAALAGLPEQTRRRSVGSAMVQLLTQVAGVLGLFDDKPAKEEDILEDPFAELRRTFSGEDYVWLLRETGSKIAGVRPFIPRGSRTWRDFRSRAHFGWPDLQLNLLKEAVDLGTILDYPTISYDFLCLLIRRFHLVLSPKECMDAVRQLGTAWGDLRDEEVVRKEDRDVPRLSLGVPVVVKLELERPAPARLVYVHRAPLEDAQQVDEVPDAFIYNPYDEKLAEKAGPADLACGEPVTVDVTLANPLDIDLPLSKVSIWISGVQFEPTVTACMLPAQAREFKIQLMGTPMEAGELEIRGIKVQTIGGIEEEISPLGQSAPRPEEERERLLGKVNMTVIPQLSSRQVSTASQIAPAFKQGPRATVLSPQPILECINSTLGTQNTLALFEGERSSFALTVVNAGPVAIESLAVTFKDEYEATSTVREGPEAPEDIYEREVHDKAIKAFWLEGEDEGKRQILVEPLQPGDSRTVSIGCLGRRKCIGTTVVFEYSGPRPSPTEHYTRVLVVPAILTVLRALEPESIQAMPYEDLFGDPDAAERRRTHYLAAVDVRNASSEAFSVSLVSPLQSDRKDEVQAVQPGAVKRLYVALPRHLPSESPPPIPAPPGQFVITRVIQYPPDEAPIKAKVFWYREALFGGLETKGAAQVEAQWTCGPRRGAVDLRRLKLRADLLEFMELEDLQVDLAASEQGTLDMATDTAELKIGQLVNCIWTVRNACTVPIRPVFVIQIVHAGTETPVEWAKELAVNGPSTALLPSLQPGGEGKVDHKIGFAGLVPGRFEVRWHVIGRAPGKDQPRRVHRPVRPLSLVVVERDVAGSS